MEYCPACAASRNPKTVPYGVSRPRESEADLEEEAAGADCKIWPRALCAESGRQTERLKTRKTICFEKLSMNLFRRKLQRGQPSAADAQPRLVRVYCNESGWLQKTGRRQRQLSAFGAVHMRACAKKNLGGLHHCFGKRGMRMNGHGQITGERGHFNGENTLGDKFPRPSPNNANAEDALGVRVDDQLPQGNLANLTSRFSFSA